MESEEAGMRKTSIGIAKRDISSAPPKNDVDRIIANYNRKMVFG